MNVKEACEAVEERTKIEKRVTFISTKEGIENLFEAAKHTGFEIPKTKR